MKCGQSDQRNQDYLAFFDERAYFRAIIETSKPVIFDVGAHWGESIEFFKGIFPDSEIHSFEPDPESIAKIEDSPGVVKNNVALSSCEGRSLFYRQSLTHLSSMHPINPASADSLGYAHTALNEKIEIQAMRGDSYMKSHHVSRIDLLKIDVQGAEVDVLRGFDTRLAEIGAIIVEIGLFDFYERHTSFFEIETIIREYFQLWDILKLSKNPKNFRTDWVEAVYRRSL